MDHITKRMVWVVALALPLVVGLASSSGAKRLHDDPADFVSACELDARVVDHDPRECRGAIYAEGSEETLVQGTSPSGGDRSPRAWTLGAGAIAAALVVAGGILRVRRGPPVGSTA